ncbi:hypothetical protein B0I26_12327 [Anoxybacillus vitaminiphilus]|uniref:Uncharacterized protein n=1 Tax=Paranoxybacillus vitaminiphilus TaxID=581036 RepID=A0A327Y4C9_9BACL|nr:hypothetical protein B0I26_12327 [Anoxybacillus vitaminiphilus]
MEGIILYSAALFFFYIIKLQQNSGGARNLYKMITRVAKNFMKHLMPYSFSQTPFVEFPLY